MKLEVIIPNYNGAQLISKNLPAVINSVEHYNADITIVDDASRGEDIALLEKVIDDLSQKTKIRISLLKNTENKGFAVNVNRAALQSDSDFLILLNSDVSPEADFLKSPLHHLKKDIKLFGVGCMDKSIEGTTTVLRGRGTGTFIRGFLVHQKASIENETNTLWISGGSSIVRTAIFKKLGGFDEVLSPFYWEDIDISYRAVKSGYSIMFDRESVVEHRHDEGSIKNNFNPYFVKTIAYRNQILFMWKNITSSTLLLSHLMLLPYHGIKTLLQKDTAFIHGLVLAVVRIPDIISKRIRQKRQYILSDYDVISKASSV